MHITQVHILEILRQKSPRRYSELKPKEVEANVFMHHLKAVIKQGLVNKVETGYELTTEGGRFVIGFAKNGIRKTIQPLILVEVAVQNEKGEWLLTKCLTEPFLDLIGFPAGRIHLGESVAEAAKREFTQKTGLVAEVQHVGNMYQQTFKGEELICHLLTHIFVGRVTSGVLDENKSFYQGDLDLNDTKTYFPGLKSVINCIQNRPREGQFFEECTYKI